MPRPPGARLTGQPVAPEAARAGLREPCRRLVPRLCAVCLLAGFTGAAFTAGAASSPGALSPGLPGESPARGKFLIATQQLAHPAFAQSVVLLLDHDARGALGLVVNRPAGVTLAGLLPEFEGLASREDRVHLGGPVERTRLFLLMRAETPPAGTERILSDTFGSSGLDPLRALRATGAAESAVFVVYAGYAGWAAGQLEAEIARGDWLVGAGDSSYLFDVDAGEVWPRLLREHRGTWVEAPGGRAGPERPALPRPEPRREAGRSKRISPLAIVRGILAAPRGEGRSLAPEPMQSEDRHAEDHDARVSERTNPQHRLRRPRRRRQDHAGGGAVVEDGRDPPDGQRRPGEHRLRL